MDINHNEIVKSEIDRNIKEKNIPKNTLPPAFKIVPFNKTVNALCGPVGGAPVAPVAPVSPVSTY